MRARIKLASGEAEHDALFAFRYRIYVDEMQRVQKYADHRRRRISDPLDDTAYNLVAWRDDEVVGCVRVNFARDGGLAYYRDLLRMDVPSTSYPDDCSLCTRLMVLPEWRGSTLALQFCVASFELGLRHAIGWNFIDCNDHLVGFFERVGFEWLHKAAHEEYGLVNAMRLNMNDLARWRAPGSVFRRAVERFEATHSIGGVAAHSTEAVLAGD